MPTAADRGIALTPYSYERLDGLKGYESGMPNPGFYHQAWEDGTSGQDRTHRQLLSRVAKILRERGQPISAADLIAVETTARGLAALRGHAIVWRRDLVDGIAAALVKDESGRGQVASAARRRARGLPRRGARPAGRGDRLPAARPGPEAPPRRGRLRARAAVPRGRAGPRLRAPTATGAGCCTRSSLLQIAGFAARGRDRLRPPRRSVAVLGALADRLVAGPRRLRHRGVAVRPDARRGRRRPAGRGRREASSAMPAPPPGSCSTRSSPGSTRWPATCNRRLAALIRQDGDFLGRRRQPWATCSTSTDTTPRSAAGAEGTSAPLLAEAFARALWLVRRAGTGRRPGKGPRRGRPRPAPHLRRLRRGSSASIAPSSSTS